MLNKVILALVVASGLVAASYAMAEKQEEGKNPAPSQSASADAKPEAKALLAKKPGDHFLGNEKAKVTIIEYSWLACHACAAFSNDTFPKLKENYIDTGKVLFIHRDFPVNDAGLRGSMLAHCSGNDNYFTFLKVLFQTQPAWAFGPNFKDALKKTATLGGISPEKFDECMKDQTLEIKLIDGRKQAADLLGVSSTPTFFVNGRKVLGAISYAEFSGIIEEELKK